MSVQPHCFTTMWIITYCRGLFKLGNVKTVSLVGPFGVDLICGLFEKKKWFFKTILRILMDQYISSPYCCTIALSCESYEWRITEPCKSPGILRSCNILPHHCHFMSFLKHCVSICFQFSRVFILQKHILTKKWN